MTATEGVSPLAGTDLSVRPARVEDLPQIANLLIQLYEAELPGALSGSRIAQQHLLQFSLEANSAQGLRQRYVIADNSGDVLATAALDLPGSPPYERAPAGTIRKAFTTIGGWNTLQLLLVVARSLIYTHRPRLAQSALIHSVVVDKHQRQHGLGKMIVCKLEHISRAVGVANLMLQVLDSNYAARQFYHGLGYKVIWSSPIYLHMITWPIHLMHKQL